MALTIKEQLDILTGVVSPPSYSLNQYVEQSAVDAAQDFFESTKDVDRTVNQEAFIYKEKVMMICTDIARNASRFTPSLTKLLLAIYADTGTMAQVEAAGDDGWLTFISNNMLNSIEKLSGVSNQQKADYDSLP